MVPIVIRRLAAAALSLALVSVAAGCSDDSGGEHTGGPTVVVTYSVLGAVVRDIVGDSADVVVLMPNGADPHEWSPSAKDVEAMLNADVLVENGLGLEGNLQDPLSEARSNGVRVFTVSDHITVRKVKAGEGADAEDPDQALLLDIAQDMGGDEPLVVAVEAIEGTDRMIERVGDLCRAKGWTLCKGARAGHDRRSDVPTVGVTTIQKLHEAGGRCLALAAGDVIMVDKPEMIRLADSLGIAIVGVAMASSGVVVEPKPLGTPIPARI